MTKFALKQSALNIKRILSSKRSAFKNLEKSQFFSSLSQVQSIDKNKKKKRTSLLLKISAKKLDTIDFEDKKRRFEFYWCSESEKSQNIYTVN